MRVQIYIYQSPSFGYVKHGKAIWLIQVMTIKGPATRYGIVKADNISARRLFLIALKEALIKLTKRCQIELYTTDRFFVSVIYRGLLSRWSKNGYKSARGADIKNKDLWEEVNKLSNLHTIRIVEAQDHEYMSWMITQLKGVK